MEFPFPQHNGHPAWPYYAETVEDAAIEDLFWRKMQTDPVFTKKVLKAMWPCADERQEELLIIQNFGVSLRPESCGAYAGLQPCALNYLNGNHNDHERIMKGIRHPDMGGYYLGPLAAEKRGWLPKNVVHNLMQGVKGVLKASDRFYFSQKGSHHQILINELAQEEIEAVMARAYPTLYGFSQHEVYWYRTENGRITHGIVYFKDSQGNMHKLPISAWEPKYPTRRRTNVYDMLNIGNIYPLYYLNRLVTFSVSWTLVCASEATVENIYKNHGWISNSIPVTTYSSLIGTDWTKIKGKTPIIFPDASKSGCYEAFRLHATLEELDFELRFIKRQKDAVVGSLKFDQDLMSGMGTSNPGCSFPEFAEHCRQEFGVQPPDGILPKAVSLSSLPESDVAPEPLMDCLLDTGEQMMIYAWRGVGKSLFAMLLGLCFASGKSALNGSVRPSRKYRVLLLDGEMSSASLKKRGYKLCSGHELPQEAMDSLKVRSMIVEKKDLALETEEGLKAIMPDLEWAEIIIVDSIFKFFPQAMGSDFERAEKLLSFLSWCKKNEKTLILIDHEGKNRGTPFGTMAKEIGLDVVLQLCKNKSDHWIKLEVKKARNHVEPSGAYSELYTHTSEKGTSICFQVRNKHKSKTLLTEESPVHSVAAEFPKSSEALDLDEVIMRYVNEHPDFTQTRIAADLVKQGYGGRSTIHSRIKVLSESGKLSGWLRRPKNHKVAGLSASEGDGN